MGLSLFFLSNPNLAAGPAEEGAGPGAIIPNSNLVAELSSEYEFGFDAKFFNNRLGLDVTYYNKDTKNPNIGQFPYHQLRAHKVK